jgi:hypothetical protein
MSPQAARAKQQRMTAWWHLTNVTLCSQPVPMVNTVWLTDPFKVSDGSNTIRLNFAK